VVYSAFQWFRMKKFLITLVILFLLGGFGWWCVETLRPPAVDLTPGAFASNQIPNILPPVKAAPAEVKPPPVAEAPSATQTPQPASKRKS